MPSRKCFIDEGVHAVQTWRETTNINLSRGLSMLESTGIPVAHLDVVTDENLIRNVQLKGPQLISATAESGGGEGLAWHGLKLKDLFVLDLEDEFVPTDIGA
jgi:hypothetical protein